MWRPRKTATIIETPQALAETYWNELLELIEHGEITPARARQIKADMFEDGAPGDPPRLRRSAWLRYLEEFKNKD